VNVGVAAHITAASPGGKRYDPCLSPEQRKHPNNAIWLCQYCAKLIDSDELRFTVSVLHGWKSAAEAEACARLAATATSLDPTHATFSQEELDLLIYAAEKGDIHVLSSDEMGSWISIGPRHFWDKLDPAVAAAYVEAVESLCSRRLAKHDGGVLFVLTGTRFRIGRALKKFFDTRSE
jgi:hypothetical protein